MAQIFVPFYSTKKPNKNFGIGLSYCKNVMQAHDGLIEVCSEMNSETKFVLKFPAKRIKRKDVIVNE